MSKKPVPRFNATPARAAGLVVMMAFAMATVAPGSATAGSGHDTFRGSCEIPATVRFDPPLSGSTQQTHTVADGKGPCSGTWTTPSGRKITLNNRTVVYHAEADGRQSCASSEGTSGPGYFRLRRHKISFAFSESRVGIYTPITLQGKKGGVFEGRADFSTDQDPVEAVQECASTGLAQALVVIRGSTDPHISG